MCPVRDGQMDGWTEEPQPCREPRGVQLVDGSSLVLAPGQFWLQLVCSFRSSSWMAPGQFMAPAHLQLQPMDGSGWFQLQLVVVPASLQLQVQLLDSSSSVLAPAHLRFPSQAQLICRSGSSSVLAPAHLWFPSQKWMTLDHFSSSWLWFQLVCSFRSSSSPLQCSWSPSSSPTDSQFRGVCGSSSSPVELVLVPAILAFGQAVNQSLSPLGYEYDLS
ncbi:hypothetical protein GRJ2_001413400 [Grus japonensis]|uniref:Uncharacterized protein n=1 Tax=Grus japonensis TaxID=30415 RepID=A0ABC9WW08_GRUJA